MGVKKSLDPALEEELGSINRTAPRYSLWSKLKLILSLMHKSKKYVLSTERNVTVHMYIAVQLLHLLFIFIKTVAKIFQCCD